MLITFSGLDGVGKTTHAGLLAEHLISRGKGVKVLRMQDDFSTSAWLRRKLARNRHKTKNPPLPAAAQIRRGFRRDKNQKGRLIVAMRLLVYLLDLVFFAAVRFYHQTWKKKVIICDRYLIDSMVNLSNANKLAELYSRLFLFMIPLPDLPLLLDVEALVAFHRKPEYPLAYNIERRDAYLNVFRKLKGGVIIRSTNIPETQRAITRHLEQAACRAAPVGRPHLQKTTEKTAKKR